VSKVRACQSEAPFGRPLKHYISLERLASDKHSSLLEIIMNYNTKRFYNIGPKRHCWEHIFIYLWNFNIVGFCWSAAVVLGVEHSPCHLEVCGSSSATVVGNRMEKINKNSSL
jgi:hypothetical protein